MSLYELSVIHEVPKMTDEQLLDIKDHGYNAEAYKVLVEKTGAEHYQSFVLGRVANELIDRGLMDAESELS